MAKHIDKLEWDAREGVRTLPVILGEQRARRATIGLMVGFYVLYVVSGARIRAEAGGQWTFSPALWTPAVQWTHRPAAERFAEQWSKIFKTEL